METLRLWWIKVGQNSYPNAKRLLINADTGGSNGYYVGLSKTGIPITVGHFPPSTSKQHKFEHRLLSHITMN